MVVRAMPSVGHERPVMKKVNSRFDGVVAPGTAGAVTKPKPTRVTSPGVARTRRWLMNSATIHSDFQKMDFHTYVNKEITFVRSNDIRKYARGKHTQLNIG